MRKRTRMLVHCALAIALAYVISYFPIYKWPQGGSVTVASMLPIFFIAVRYGTKTGILCGLVYSVLQFVQDPWFLTPVQFALDYPLAFGALGLAGLFRQMGKWGRLGGILFGGFCRFVSHLLSGVFFFAQYAPKGMNPWVYSAAVNGSVMGTEVAICLVVAWIMMDTGAWQRIERILE